MAIKHVGHQKAYQAWQDMMKRCFDSKNRCFKNYGGRGITCCHEWKTFANFYADMGAPMPGYSLERTDNNSGYCKENCRWATLHEQSRNTSRNNWLEYNGERMVLTDWAKKLGVEQATLWRRKDAGLPSHLILSPNGLKTGLPLKVKK